MACHYVCEVAKGLCGVSVCADVNVNSAAVLGVAYCACVAELAEDFLKGRKVIV